MRPKQAGVLAKIPEFSPKITQHQAISEKFANTTWTHAQERERDQGAREREIRVTKRETERGEDIGKRKKEIREK